MNRIAGLTPSEKRTLQAIESFIAEHSYSPTVREICERMGKHSTSVTHYSIRNLASKGYIEHHHAIARGIKVRRSSTTGGPDIKPPSDIGQYVIDVLRGVRVLPHAVAVTRTGINNVELRWPNGTVFSMHIREYVERVA